MTTSDGLITIKNLNYDFKDEYVNVYSFETIRNPRMLRFEEQNIAVESKIRLEKEDVKSLLDRKMNRNVGGIYQNNVVPRRPISAQPPSPSPRQPPPPRQPPQPQQPQQPPPTHQQLTPQQRQYLQQQQQQQHMRKNMYRGIGMGGVI
jgi:hypothetical protein